MSWPQSYSIETGLVTDTEEEEEEELTKVEAHEEVSHGKVTDKEPGHVDSIPAAGEDEHDTAVAEESEQEDNPDATTKSPPVEEVVARKEGAGGGVAVDPIRGAEIAAAVD